MHHTWILRASSTTSEKGDESNNHSNDDHEDGCIDEASVSQKIKVILHVNLHVTSQSNQCCSSDEEHKVEKKNGVSQQRT